MADRAVFLDRDGVLVRAVVRNGKPYPPARPDTMEIIPGVRERLMVLKAKEYKLIVVTNQVDVGRGTQKKEVVEEMHERLRFSLPIDDIFVCYSDEDVEMKKPAPGMLLEAAKRWNIDLTRSFMVGDRWKDVEAGRRAGSRTVFIKYGYDEPAPTAPDHVSVSVPEALDWIVGEP